MASPAQLVETLSLVTGVPLPTVIDIDRKLVTAELRTKGGRGLHAARMTPLDAARLLTAVLASSQANTAAETVARYAHTGVDRARSSDAIFGAAAIDDLSLLLPGHSYVDALTALIRSASVGALAKLISEAEEGRPPQIEVFAFTHATWGRIRLSGLPNGCTASVEYVPAPPLARSSRGTQGGSRRGASAPVAPGNLERSSRVTGDTIFAIAKLLAEGSNE